MGYHVIYVGCTAAVWTVKIYMRAVTTSMRAVTGPDSAAVKITENEKNGGIRKILTWEGVSQTDEINNLCGLEGLHPFE